LPPLHCDHVRRIRYFQHLVELIDDVPGDIVECGVNKGASLLMLAALTEDGRYPRRVWGFDSFEGLPGRAPQDEPDRKPDLIKAGRLAESEAAVRIRLLRSGISRKEFESRFVLVKGWFPTTFADYADGPIALLHLDVDLYQSYKDCLEWLEPRVAAGGVIAFDEYEGKWVGARRAIEEYFGGHRRGSRETAC
jgi:hypothetical protein